MRFHYVYYIFTLPGIVGHVWLFVYTRVSLMILSPSGNGCDVGGEDVTEFGSGRISGEERKGGGWGVS